MDRRHQGKAPAGRLPSTAAEVHALIGGHAESHDRRGTGFAPSVYDAYTITIEGLLAAFRAAEQACATATPLQNDSLSGVSTTHTPGPWILDIPDRSEHPFARYANVRAERWGCVARIGIDTSLPHWDGPQRANARLITAAPELLAALTKARATIWIERQALVESHTGPDGRLDQDGSVWVEELDSELAEIDAAITAATGVDA